MNMCVCVWCAWPRVVGIWRLILFLWVCASVPRSMAHKLFCERWMCVHLSTSPSLCLSFFVSLCVRGSVCLSPLLVSRIETNVRFPWCIDQTPHVGGRSGWDALVLGGGQFW